MTNGNAHLKVTDFWKLLMFGDSFPLNIPQNLGPHPFIIDDYLPMFRSRAVQDSERSYGCAKWGIYFCEVAGETNSVSEVVSRV